MLLGAPPALIGQPAAPPALVLGDFGDDHGHLYRITREAFEMLPRTRHHIVAWQPDRQFLIARADSTASAPRGSWLRIDWMALSGMAPYTWAYCFTAYSAPTADSARVTRSADRTTPRTRCGGHPFPRMNRLDNTGQADSLRAPASSPAALRGGGHS